MHALYDVPAPAKLNLFLHVTGRRTDGYHLLQSAFMLIDWCDTLHFERRPGSSVSRQDLGTALPPDDLIVRAARALQTATGCTQGVHISVQKRIPSQAGMGGGSSDAASALLALNRLWRLKLKRAQLMRIGLSLGADVPFFLWGRNAWVEGIGEQIETLSLPPACFLVLKPWRGIDTGKIFSDPALKRDSSAATIPSFAADPYAFGRNDLQPVAVKLCSEIPQALEWLSSQGLVGRMTGSGSAVFAQVSPEQVDRGIDLSGLPEEWQARLCSNLECHPLGGWASGDV